MIIQNLPMLFRMGFSPSIWIFIFRMIGLLKKDKNYSFIKLAKASLNTLKGEKIVKHGKSYIITSFLPPIPSRAFDSVATAVPKPENIFTQQMNAQRCAPISIFCEVTERCNYRCRHCSISGRDHSTELTTEEWLKVIRDLQEMGTAIIGFTGGEPLLRKDIATLISAVDARSVSILYTNGSYLTLEKAQELKEAGLYAAGISLDSCEKEEHNDFRGIAGSFEKSVEAIRNASTAGLYTFAQRVVLPKDLDEKKLFKYFRFAGEIGAREIRILEPIPCGRLLDADKSIFYTAENREYLRRIQYKANRSHRFPKITTFAHTESMEQFGCGAGTQHSYISSSGELFPCDFTPLSFGKVTEKSVIDLWQEMTNIMGVPKTHCFAMDLARYFENKPETKFPTTREISEKICLEHRQFEFPQFYRLMQGKKKK